METPRDAALRALAAHYQSMPPVAAMGIEIAHYDEVSLRLHAPLSLHVNDKGCAFGGSMGSLLTLAAWGLTSLRLQDAGLAADVFVAESDVRFVAPLYDDIAAEARLDDDASWEEFIATLRQRGRARAVLVGRVALPGGQPACESRARFVAIAKG